MSETGQQNIAQIMQRNQQLEDSLVRLKARLFDAEDALQQQTRNVQGIVQEIHVLAAVVNEHAPLALRNQIVQAAPSFGNGLIKTEPEPAQEPVGMPAQEATE